MISASAMAIGLEMQESFNKVIGCIIKLEEGTGQYMEKKSTCKKSKEWKYPGIFLMDISIKQMDSQDTVTKQVTKTNEK